MSSTQQQSLVWLQENNVSGFQLGFDELLMYRHFGHLLSLKPKSNVKHHMSGQYLAKTKGRGMEFDESRHYQPGDDVRAIDWRVTARTGKAHTKIFKEEKDRPIFILTDLLPSMRFGSQLLFKSVQACHLSALIAWSAKQNGDKIGGIILSENHLVEAKPRSRQKAVLTWLNQLMTCHNSLDVFNKESASQENQQASKKQQQQRFEKACAHLRRLAHPGSLVYVISDFQNMNKSALQHLFQLQKHCEVAAYCINDPLEQTLPSNISGLMPVTDGASSKIVTSSEQLKQYRAASHRHFQVREKALTQYKIQWHQLSAGLPLSEQL